ncbi:hypothetical protein L1987_14958 [Smallanthus sonchifolius]|uniref:Uncharacterized protein n=1 Tax=Smallanthus sonchifolius TaxID=185202 RepID=A0ACB9J6H2_9ASTR|nr:hypothetical protein L1987_14958 [Smallanthus sonchifolius]
MLFVVFLLLLSLEVIKSQFLVKTLPGLVGDLPFKLETGVGESDGVQLFYYVIESEGNLKDDPLMLWISGGPGCSSIIGLIYEIGPITFNSETSTVEKPILDIVPDSLTKVASIIFLDQPAGSGFSYAKTPQAYIMNDTLSAKQSYNFLRKVVFGDMDSNHDEDSNLQKPASDHDEETKSQRGPTIKPKANKGKTMITYNKRGVPIGDGAKKLATFEGMTARTMVPITFDSWIQMQETGKTEEEIDRATLWKKARELKTRGCFESCGTHDVLTEALGTEEQRGHVRGLGKYVKPHQYFYEPKSVKQYLDTEKKKVDERFNKLEEEVEKLKRGVTNVSEAASCQMGGYEDDLEDKPHEESLDNSCYLAVDVASNIVAKGAIMKYSDSGEIIEVMMEMCVQGEAFLPIPLEEELIMKVKDAVGHILSWPRHLVIRCSDLEKAVAKPKSKKRLREHDEENGKEKKQPVEPDEVVEKENAKENGKENAKKDDAIVENKKEIEKEKENEKKDDERVENKKERGKEKENEKELLRRRMTRAQRKTRIRIENNVLLRMTAMMVDGQVSKVDSIKVQCEDGLYE